MKRLLLQPLIKGSMVVVPLLVTVWLLWSALLWFNNLGTQALAIVGIPGLFPGMGLVLMLIALLVVGLLFQFNPVSWLYQYVEDALLRFPLVKTLYGAIKDFAAMLIRKNASRINRRCWSRSLVRASWSALLPQPAHHLPSALPVKAKIWSRCTCP